MNSHINENNKRKKIREKKFDEFFRQNFAEMKEEAVRKNRGRSEIDEYAIEMKASLVAEWEVLAWEEMERQDWYVQQIIEEERQYQERQRLPEEQRKKLEEDEKKKRWELFERCMEEVQEDFERGKYGSI